MSITEIPTHGPAANRPRALRRLVREVTGLVTVVELFDTAVVELFEDDDEDLLTA